MDTTIQRSREVALPSRSFTALRAALRKEAGPLATIHALQAAGFETGDDLYESFSRAVGGGPDQLGSGHFWRKFRDFLRSRGWGTLEHRAPHRGVGVLTSGDWVEADEDGQDGEPSCSFSSGMLAGFLTKAAGGPVAVLQTACRSRGDDCCVFAFGSEATVHDLYGHLLDGGSLDDALSRL